MADVFYSDKRKSISRREFLRLSGTGFVSALGLSYPTSRFLFKTLDHSRIETSLSPGNLKYLLASEILKPNQQGRVLDSSIDVFDIPSFRGKRMKTYWRDWVLPITEITIGKSEDSFNMVWYKLGEEGYSHSGALQPVFTSPNSVATEIPEDGILAEVTVPFTDAHWDPGENEPVAYRFYYSTTYWVTDIVHAEDGNPWYAVTDDKWEYVFYVPANHLRLIQAEELAPISPEIPFSAKRIEVHIPQQLLVAFEYDQPVLMARVASGAVFRNGDFSTPAGRFTTFHKRASRHMARGNLAENGYDLPGVPWNSYITEEGIAIHGTYWHNNFGKPRSHGCINLTPQAAKWIYLWTSPTVSPKEEDVHVEEGTRVDIIG